MPRKKNNSSPDRGVLILSCKKQTLSCGNKASLVCSICWCYFVFIVFVWTFEPALNATIAAILLGNTSVPRVDLPALWLLDFLTPGTLLTEFRLFSRSKKWVHEFFTEGSEVQVHQQIRKFHKYLHRGKEAWYQQIEQTNDAFFPYDKVCFLKDNIKTPRSGLEVCVFLASSISFSTAVFCGHYSHIFFSISCPLNKEKQWLSLLIENKKIPWYSAYQGYI